MDNCSFDEKINRENSESDLRISPFRYSNRVIPARSEAS